MAELEQYEADLKKHDWFYNFSDDHAVYKRGQAEQKRLEALREKLDPNREIWNKYERI